MNSIFLKPLLNAGKHAVLRRNLGSKHQKMIYGEEGSAGKSVVVVDVENKNVNNSRWMITSYKS